MSEFRAATNEKVGTPVISRYSDGRLSIADSTTPNYRLLVTDAEFAQMVQAVSGLTKPPDPPVPPTTAKWRSNFAAALFKDEDWYTGREWNWPDRDLYPDNPLTHIVDPTVENVPVRSDRRVARFEVSPIDASEGQIHSKLYHYEPWATAKGTYSASFYVKSSVDVNVNGWGVNDHKTEIFQFKDNYGPGGASKEEAWVHLLRNWGGAGADVNRPQLVLNGTDFTKNWAQWVNCPLDQWFVISALIDPASGVGIFYLNNVEFARTGAGEIKARHTDSKNITFGIGAYGKALGAIYSDAAQFVIA